ncbi:MAG TPA: hypothetical protein VFK69_00275 [Candidatus Eisenbacteria bacterium]|nr:hypothetical protein [Candidatus Eisenbacteria bacterium]
MGRGMVCALLALALCACARAALASDTQWWVSDSPSDYAKAETRGVVVDADGVARVGPDATSWSTDSLAVAWAVAPMRDGSLAIGGDHGRILRFTPGGGIHAWVRLAAGQVLSLAPDGDGLVAGTGPDGSVWHVSARGDTTRLARTGERYVWALTPAGPGAWYAATGTRGRLLRVSAGKVAIVHDSDESNLVSMAPDGHGGVYVGGDSHGRVLHVLQGGAVRTLFDASEDEIRGLALGPDGALYAAALGASAVTGADEDKDDEGPAPARATPAAQAQAAHAVVYRIVPDSSVTAWWASPQPAVFALLSGPRGALFAATGNRAGVYAIERANIASAWLTPPQGQVTAMTAGPGGALFAVTSNPVAVWRLGGAPAAKGTVISDVLDTHRVARFGRIVVHGAPHAALETRSGNTETPDNTWSAWQPPDRAGGALGVRSPPARYLQWKAELSSGDALSALEVAWREQNLPPRVEDVTVAPQGQGFREGEIIPRSEPVTQTLPGGQKVEYSIPPVGGARPLHELPAWTHGLRVVQWRASDPNGDPLRYRIDVRAEGANAWLKVVDNLDQSGWTWDTNALPDGAYRVRVTATDAEGNAVGEERTDAAVSEPFTVDNTPPSLDDLAAEAGAGRVTVRGRAVDRGSGLARVEVSLDDQDWRAVTPDGGLTDGLDQSFSATLPATAGEHTVSARAVDRAGNTATRAAHVTVR